MSTDGTDELPADDDAGGDAVAGALEPLLAAVLTRLARAGLQPRLLAWWATGPPAPAPVQGVLDVDGR
jgi:hypothetical protein